jgi:predicted amidophosphoribosyltransferase
MKQDLDFCPYCGIGINNREKEMRFCQNCHTHWDSENEIEEEEPEEQVRKTYTKPESYFFNKREPNGDSISDYKL